MADHIPGPPVRYEFDEHGGYDCMSAGYRVVDADGRTCVTVDTKEFRSARMMESCTPLAEAEALARVITAAPEMLAALRFLRFSYAWEHLATAQQEAVERVIAKAEAQS